MGSRLRAHRCITGEIEVGDVIDCAWCGDPSDHREIFAAMIGNTPIDDTDDTEEIDTSHDHEADGLEKCTDCKGSGIDPVRPADWCERCDGSGWL